MWRFSRPNSLEACYLIPGVPTRGSRFPSSTYRDGRSRRCAGQCACALSRAVPARCGDEPMPLRVLKRTSTGLRARAEMRTGLSVPRFWPAVRSHRSACRGRGRLRVRSRLAATVGGQRCCGSARRTSPRAPTYAFRRPEHPHQRRSGWRIARQHCDARRGRCEIVKRRREHDAPHRAWVSPCVARLTHHRRSCGRRKRSARPHRRSLIVSPARAFALTVSRAPAMMCRGILDQ
jgi:hypothetical protein